MRLIKSSALRCFLIINLLTGCAPALFLEKPHVEVPGDWHNKTDPVLPTLAHDANWWKLLNDPRLSALIKQGLQESSSMRLAHLNLERAQQTARLTEAVLSPSIISMAGVNVLDNPIFEDFNLPKRTNYYNLSAVGNYNFDIFGRLGDRRDSALSVLLAERFILQATALETAAAIATGYINIGFLQDRLTLIKALLEQEKDIEALTALRVHAGKVRQQEQEAAKQLVNKQQASLRQAELAVSETRQALALLIRCKVEELELKQINMPQLSQVTPITPGLPSELLLRRPDIRAAEARLIAAHFNIEAARKAFYPDLSLTLEGGWASTALRTLGNGNGFNLSLGILSPLIQSKRLSIEHESAVTAYRIEAEHYLYTIRKSFSEVEQALAARYFLSQEARDLNDALEHALKAEGIFSIRVREGADSKLVLLHQRKARLQTELLVLDNRYRQLQTFIKFGKALGGAWLY